MNKLLEQSLRILAGRMSVSFVSVLFTVYFAYVLDKATFALIALYTTLSTLAQVVIDLGLSYKVIREAPALMNAGKTDEAMRTIIFPSVFLRIAASLIVLIVIFLFFFFIRAHFTQTFPDLSAPYILTIAGFSIFFECLSTISIQLFQIRRQFGLNSILNGSAQTLENILATILYIYAGMNHYFTGVLLAQGAIALLRFWFVRQLLAWYPHEVRMKTMRPMLKYYFPMYVRRFFRFGFLQGEQLLVALMLPLEQVANFNLAKRFSKYMKAYLEAFSDPLSVRLSRTRDISVRQQYQKTFYMFTIPVPLILAILSPWIMKYGGGEKYADYWPILSILFVSYSISALSIFQFTVVTILGQPQEALKRDVIGSITGLSATFALIWFYGEYGLAWGQVITYLTLYITGYHISQKYLRNQDSVHTTL
ncbi:oligosaccharide flippase family protein [bacterium]|nr:oligosaccharide flippase family protein [bacterium]NUN46936.1 oligosaccharide flippase family protein [bacterium]